MVKVSFFFFPFGPGILVRTVMMDENSPERPLGLNVISILPDFPGARGRGEKSEVVQSQGVVTVITTSGALPVFLYANEQFTGPLVSRILPKSNFLRAKVMAGSPAAAGTDRPIIKRTLIKNRIIVGRILNQPQSLAI